MEAAQEITYRKFLKLKVFHKWIGLYVYFELIQPIRLRDFMRTHWYKPAEVKVSGNNSVFFLQSGTF